MCACLWTYIVSICVYVYMYVGGVFAYPYVCFTCGICVYVYVNVYVYMHVYLCIYVTSCWVGEAGLLQQNNSSFRFGRKHHCVWIPSYMLTLYSIQCTSYPSSNIEESDKFLITSAVYWISILIQEHVSEWSDMTDHQRWIWWKVPLRCQATERMICPFIQS